jgi:microcystin-dependent protein
LGDVKVVSSYTLDFNSFKIVLADASGTPLDMTGTTVPTIPWDFNILITKGGKLIRSGKYRFTNSSGLVIQRITPTGNTINIMNLYGETPVAEEVVPAPVGTIIMYGGLSAPAGYFVCSGAAISRTTYSALFAKIGVVWGRGDLTTTFNLPDLRDRFIRGAGGTLGGEVGTIQSDTIKSHNHTATVAFEGSHTHTATIANAGSHTHSGTTNTSGQHNHAYNERYSTNPTERYPTGLLGDVTLTGRQNFTSVEGNHAHSFTTAVDGTHAHSATINSVAAHTHATTISVTGSLETRPLAACVLYCIKY